MGRIKTKAIKRVTLELIDNYYNEFCDDFTKNKSAVTVRTDIPSKKLRNMIAGYATRKFKSREQL